MDTIDTTTLPAHQVPYRAPAKFSAQSESLYRYGFLSALDSVEALERAEIDRLRNRADVLRRICETTNTGVLKVARERGELVDMLYRVLTAFTEGKLENSKTLNCARDLLVTHANILRRLL